VRPLRARQPAEDQEYVGPHAAGDVALAAVQAVGDPAVALPPVRASRIAQSATWARLVQTFWPVTRKPSPLGSAQHWLGGLGPGQLRQRALQPVAQLAAESSLFWGVSEVHASPCGGAATIPQAVNDR
jgi:hypothetical protein